MFGVSTKKYLILFFVLLISSISFLQEKQIEEKRTELSSLKNEINQLESELEQKSEQEKKSLDALENITRQNHLLNKVILGIKKEENAKQVEIDRTNKEIKKTEDDISELKKNYETYIVSIYKYGILNEWESVFNSESFRQAILRIEYLKKFSDRREEDLDKLAASKEKLIVLKDKLEEERELKASLIAEKRVEEKKLKSKQDERKNILSSIRNDKQLLKKNLAAKIEAEKNIRNLITKLVEEAERKRGEQLASLNNESTTESSGNVIRDETPIEIDTRNFSSFTQLKGKMNWPLDGGKVTRKFGEERNSVLNTVTINYGIDIASQGNLNVKAVAEGIVSAIDWIPGYGSVVIVTHKDGYRTVYGHLADIYLSEGDKVKPGSLIGKVNESVEGNLLHFEIWKARKNENPENWLKKM